MAVLNRHSSYISFHISVFSFNINNLKYSLTGNPEPHITPCKGHSIHPFRVIVILRTGVKFKHFAKCREVLITKQTTQLIGETYLHLLPTLLINKTAAHTNMRIGILNVWLYIIDWSTIDKVGTGNDKRAIFNTQQAHRRQP